MRQSRDPQALREEFPALVAQALAGEQDGYTALYEATAQELYRCIHSMIRDEELTLDIQQEVYAQAFSHLDQLEDPEKLIPWLRAIAVNCVRYSLRRQNPVLFSELEDGEGPPLPELTDQDPARSPELHLERQENARLIREILDGLSAGQRMLVGMYYYEQMPVGQIAQNLGVSPGTVKTQLFRSRKKIEAAVKRLEAQGVKLYGLSPLPFLLALLKRQSPAAEAGRAALNGALTRSGAAAASEAAGEVSAVGSVSTAAGMEAVAVHVGRRFFQTLGGRLLLGLLAAAVIGGSVLAWGWAKGRLLIGDVRPTEPIELRTTLEPPDSSSAVPSPFFTEAPETTAPMSSAEIAERLTEPQTEPTASTAELSEPESPPVISDSAQPTEHPQPQPTQPAAPDPIPADPAVNAPQPTAPAAETAQLNWYWENGGEMDWSVSAGESGYETRTLVVSVSGFGRPLLRADDDSILKLVEDSGNSSDLTHTLEGLGLQRDYRWNVRVMKDGATKIRCELNGTAEKSLIVSAKTPARFVRAQLYGSYPYHQYPEKVLQNCVTGTELMISATVSGDVEPVFSTDNPSVLQISDLASASTGTPPFVDYTARISIIGAGDASILVSFSGKAEQRWGVHASISPAVSIDSSEDLLPTDAPPQVMAWYMANCRPLILTLGDSESLYVKMKGTEPPTVGIDDSSVASLSPESSVYLEDRNVSEYWYRVKALKSGVCSINCSFAGSVVFTVPVVVP